MSLEEKTLEFKQKIIDSGIVDGEGVHHVFSQGLHGQKIDFDLIEDTSELYGEWVDLTAEFITQNYDSPPDIVVGVANGTNRLAISVAEALGSNVAGLVTVKPGGSRNQPVLTDESAKKIQSLKPKSALILEDVGTRGTNSASVYRSLKQTGVGDIEVLNTWQRSENLALLDDEGAKYRAVIKDVLTNYTLEECEKSGFCSKGWKLLGHDQSK